MNSNELIAQINADRFNASFIKLYGNSEEIIKEQKERYIQAVKSFEALYPGGGDISIFSAPERMEVCGNHTDHQHVCVLAAAVNLDAVAVVSFHDEHVIRRYDAGICS